MNVDGYYNSLLALFDKAVDEGFIDSTARHILVIANTAQDLLKKMEVLKKLDVFVQIKYEYIIFLGFFG